RRIRAADGKATSARRGGSTWIARRSHGFPIDSQHSMPSVTPSSMRTPSSMLPAPLGAANDEAKPPFHQGPQRVPRAPQDRRVERQGVPSLGRALVLLLAESERRQGHRDSTFQALDEEHSSRTR